MVQTIDEITAQVLGLPSHVRAELIDRLMESVYTEPLDEETLAELERRCDEIDAGTAVLIPGEEAMASVRKLIQK